MCNRLCDCGYRHKRKTTQRLKPFRLFYPGVRPVPWESALGRPMFHFPVNIYHGRVSPSRTGGIG